MSDGVRIVGNRSCKDCTQCCKLLAIKELQKPRGTWCQYCDIKNGCRIHGTHPDECKHFYCGYLTNAALDERWKPSKCRMVIVYEELHAPRLSVYVDSSRPLAWREKPFYNEIKRWASAAAATRGQVIVWQGSTAVAVLPDRDKDLGPVSPEQFIITSASTDGRGTSLDVIVVDRTDPLVRKLGLDIADYGKADYGKATNPTAPKL